MAKAPPKRSDLITIRHCGLAFVNFGEVEDKVRYINGLWTKRRSKEMKELKTEACLGASGRSGGAPAKSRAGAQETAVTRRNKSVPAGDVSQDRATVPVSTRLLIYKGFNKEGRQRFFTCKAPSLLDQPHHAHAPLMELRQNKAPRLWPEVPADPGRPLCRHGLPVRRRLALATTTDWARADLKILQHLDLDFAAFEPRDGGYHGPLTDERTSRAASRR
jgi:hypothetical protein